MNGALTWAQLREVKCSELEDAADGWGRASNRADAARDRIDKQLLASLEASQEGEAAEAAVTRLRDLSRNFQYVYTECGLVRTTLNSFAHELRAPQRKLRDALDDAGSLKFTVHEDGSVSYPAAGENRITGDELPGGTAMRQRGARAFRTAPAPDEPEPQRREGPGDRRQNRAGARRGRRDRRAVRGHTAEIDGAGRPEGHRRDVDGRERGRDGGAGAGGRVLEGCHPPGQAACRTENVVGGPDPGGAGGVSGGLPGPDREPGRDPGGGEGRGQQGQLAIADREVGGAGRREVADAARGAEGDR